MANTVISMDAASKALDEGITGLLDADTDAASVKIFDSEDEEIVEITLQDPSFGTAATDGETPASAKISVEGEPSGTATATATADHYEAYDGSGVKVIEGTCGEAASGAEMILNTTNIESGAIVTIESWDVFMPTQAA